MKNFKNIHFVEIYTEKNTLSKKQNAPIKNEYF